MVDIAALKERVLVEVRRQYAACLKVGPSTALGDALLALNAAEEAERRPRLKTAEAVCDQILGIVQRSPYTGVPIHSSDRAIEAALKCAIPQRDAEWMAAIRPRAYDSAGLMVVALEDIESLYASAKP